MLRLFQNARCALALLALLAIVSVFVVLVLPGVDLEPSAMRASRAAALAFLSIVLASRVPAGTTLFCHCGSAPLPQLVSWNNVLMFSSRC
jgi:hypothetical protein